jgi:hypothetical protein
MKGMNKTQLLILTMSIILMSFASAQISVTWDAYPPDNNSSHVSNVTFGYYLMDINFPVMCGLLKDGFFVEQTNLTESGEYSFDYDGAIDGYGQFEFYVYCADPIPLSGTTSTKTITINEPAQPSTIEIIDLFVGTPRMWSFGGVEYTTTPESITPEYSEWYINEVYVDTVQGTSNSIGQIGWQDNPFPLQADTNYTLKVKAYYNSGTEFAEYTEVFTTSPETCTNLVSDTLYSNEDHLICAGTHTVSEVSFLSENVRFEEGVIIDGSLGGEWANILNLADTVMNCNNGQVVGWADYEVWVGTNLLNLQGNDVFVSNCQLGASTHTINSWYDNLNLHIENMTCIEPNGLCFLHGGGTDAVIRNIYGWGNMLLMGSNQYVENVQTGNGDVVLGHPNMDCCSDAKWSGTLKNYEMTSGNFNLANPVVDGYINITESQFISVEFFGFSNGQQYFYNNVVSDVFNDYSDYGNGEYLTFCVEGIGNSITTYTGGDIDMGTCPAPSCSDELISGCRFTGDTNIPYGEYYVTDTFTQTDNSPTVIDCQGSTIYGEFEGQDTPHSNFIRVNNPDVTLKNCVLRNFFSVVNSQADSTTYDNLDWVEYGTDTYQDCPECGDPYPHFPQFFQNDYASDYQVIQNSYLEGEVSLNTYRDFNYERGDYCPDNEGLYVQNSENCAEWEYTTDEASCKPEMWNADLQRCEDSRGVWNNGNCNVCNIDWLYISGWYACDFNKIDGGDPQVGLYLYNNVINKTNSVLSGDNYDRRFPTAYGIQDLQIVNNTYIGTMHPEGGSSLMRLSGNKGIVVEGNTFELGDYSNAFTIFSQEWEEPMCPNDQLSISGNDFTLSTQEPDRPATGGYMSGIRNAVVENNDVHFDSSQGSISVFQFGAWQNDLINVTVRNNVFDDYALSDDLYQIYNSDNQMQNVDIYGNVFNNVVIGDRQKGWDTKFYGNTINHELYVGDSYSPTTNSQVDICNGGVGNTYLKHIYYDYAMGYGNSNHDNGLWLDPACDPLNVPEGIMLRNNAEDDVMVSLYGNGVTLIGTDGVGVTAYSGVEGFSIINSNYDNLDIQGYPVSMDVTLFNSNIENITADACVVVGGEGNTLTNVNEECGCSEDWQPDYSECLPTDEILLTYTDQNTCGTYDTLPADNGTVTNCNYCSKVVGQNETECEDYKIRNIPYLVNYDTCCAVTGLDSDCALPQEETKSCVGTHSASSITGVVVDAIVETGGEVIKYTPVIAIGSIAGYLLFLI